MSRFHDLLRRASVQEHAHVAVRPGRTTMAEVDTHGVALSDTSAAPLVSPSNDRPVPDERIDFVDSREALDRLCPCGSWSPDAAILSRNGGPYSSAMEEFRSLRSRLSLIREKQDLQKLLITSPLPKDGKTFVAANLAQVMLWRRECRLLLIDGDLRSPRLHLPLGAPSGPGLAEYLSGAATESDVIKRGALENLFFIPGGEPASNANELLANGKLRALLRRLSPAFDWIIIDSPPVIPVSDAKLIAEMCDGVLMVVRTAATPFDLARKAYQEFSERPFLGIVLNQVEKRPTYGDYYYHGETEKGRP